jgi:hypothetical protein
MVPVDEVVSGAWETALKLPVLPWPYQSISKMLRVFFMVYACIVVPVSCHCLPCVHLTRPLALDDAELILVQPLGVLYLAVMCGCLVQEHLDLCQVAWTKRPSRLGATLQKSQKMWDPEQAGYGVEHSE